MVSSKAQTIFSTLFRALRASAVWGFLLGLGYGAYTGAIRLLPQDYLHHGLYRLWCAEITRTLEVAVGTTFVAALAAMVFWGVLWLGVRALALPFKVDPRTPWGALLAILVALIAWWIGWDARGFLTDLINVTPLEPGWKALLQTWDESPLPLHWAVGIFVFSPVVVSLARIRLRPAERLRWFDRLALSRWALGVAGTALVLGLVFTRIGPDGAWRRPADRPDVVLITLDTVRADHVGCYGYARNTTPNLDALAAQGTRFTQAYAPSNWTAPSVGAMFTGLYPSEHGATIVNARLRPGPVTIAEALRNAGYATRAVISHTFVNHEVDFDQGFDVFDESAVALLAQASSADVSDVALRMLRERDRRPLFLWIHYFDPHFSYVHHPEFSFSEGYHGAIRSPIDYDIVNMMRADLSPEELQHLRDVYDEEIAYTDHHVGRVLTALRESGFFERGLLIVQADHGEEFMERGNLAHQNTLYNELVHVPLIVAGRTGLPPGATVERNVSLLNVARTVLDFCGVSTPAYPGPNLLSGTGGPNRLPLFIEGTQHRSHGEHLYAAIAGERKAIWLPLDHRWEYYDMAADPAERTNLAGTPAGLMFENLQEPLLSFEAAMQAELGERATPGTLSNEALERARALGYIGGASTNSLGGAASDADRDTAHE